MSNIDREIKKFFRVKRRDNLPYIGWKDSTRIDIYKFINSIGYNKGAEIGVCKGNNALDMFKNIENLHLILVDPWKAYRRTGDNLSEARYQVCLRRLRGRNAEYKRMTSLEAAKEVEDRTLDFVYIDGLHDFDSVISDIIAWVPKVKRDGIISGHDYVDFYQYGIIEAVRAYTYAHNIQNWYLTRIEKEPSWFWVNR